MKFSVNLTALPGLTELLYRRRDDLLAGQVFVDTHTEIEEEACRPAEHLHWARTKPSLLLSVTFWQRRPTSAPTTSAPPSRPA